MHIYDVISEDAFGTNPKRPNREGARPSRGHNPEPTYKVDEAPTVFPGAGNKPMPKGNLESSPLGAYAENVAKKLGMPADQLPHYLAQSKKETAGFSTLEEWDDGRKYEGRKDLGNTQPGDGPRFKGRGYLHLTGRWNYTHFGKLAGHPEIATNPELMKDPKIAAKVSVYYWAERVWPKLKALVKKTKNPVQAAKAATKAVQGGKGGGVERQQFATDYAAKMKKLMPGKGYRKADAEIPQDTAIAEHGDQDNYDPWGYNDKSTTPAPRKMDRGVRTYMIRKLVKHMGWEASDLELLQDNELEGLYEKHVPGATDMEKSLSHHMDNFFKKHSISEGETCPDCGGPMTMVEHGAVSKKICLSKRSDDDLGASALASCKSQGLRARDGKKSHLIGHGKSATRITVGGKKIKGKAHGGPLPDYGTRKGQL